MTMTNNLDKFIAKLNQCVSSKEGPFFIDVVADVKLLRILNFLQSSGFLNFHILHTNISTSKIFRVYFVLMDNGKPLLTKILRVSKSSRRIYLSPFNLKKKFPNNSTVFYIILSTSFGLKLINNLSFTDRNRRIKFSGEPLLAIFV